MSSDPLPVRRDLHFDIADVDMKRWHAQGPMVSHFMNALSIFFPEGERFFMHSVRLYRDRISDDPQLQRAVTGFIGQEAMHGREHEEYNLALVDAGLPAKKLERIVTWGIRYFKKLPNAMQLAITIALEHFTAILADLLLKDPRMIAGSHPKMIALWRWHALEETEHKSVAFDVYRKVMPRSLGAYLLRTGTLLVITIGFLTAVFDFHLRLIFTDKNARGWRNWKNLFSYLFGSFGVFRRIALPWLDYFRPGFQPWDHDNRQFLSGIDALVAEVQHPQAMAPAAA